MVERAKEHRSGAVEQVTLGPAATSPVGARPGRAESDPVQACVELAWRACEASFPHRAGGPGRAIEDVRASFASLMDLGGARLGVSSDGIGTKIEIAERARRYDTLGFDLVAMVVDDLAANGLEPICLSNILDVDVPDPAVVEPLMAGLGRAAAVARVVLAGGETAVLGERIRGFGPAMHFNWCATAVGVLPAGLAPIDGRAVGAGDVVVGLHGEGLRSNGFTLARRILAGSLGPDWHEQTLDSRITWAEALLEPSTIFAPQIVDLIAAGVRPHGLAHITGGGIPEKLGRVLAVTGLGAELTDLFPPPRVVAALERLGEVTAETAYRTWNMGNPFLLVLDPRDVEPVLALVARGPHEARVVGRVVADPVVTILTDHASTKTTFRVPRGLRAGTRS